MQIQKITIHNIRSIKHEEFILDKYTLLIGENNAGKSNIFRAIRIFYEDLKFNEKSDFPKFDTEDNESYIEITFLLTNDEKNNLKDEYKNQNNNLLIVRKILKTEDEDFKSLVKANQSNIFAYENGELSKKYFYGAKNISQAKLGNIIYIPELSKSDDSLKMSGPSPLREMINFVMKKVIEKSESYNNLNSAFEEFNNTFKEESKDDFSMKNLEDDINNEISNWGIEFGLNINPIKPADIVKNLVSHYIKDGNLNNQTVSIDSFGQGLQRHLIYTLLKLSVKYIEIKSTSKKEFSPDFTLILFEEPEAFLHPSQQEKMNLNLKELSKGHEQQIIITTHSPIFASKNIDSLNSIIRIKRNDNTKIYQLSQENIDNLFNENTSMFTYFLNLLSDTNTSNTLKDKIRRYKLANENDDNELKLEQEKFKYILWLDSERTSLFFAKHILICEGASEKIFLDYLINNHDEWQNLKDKHLYILDSLGKFNIHRFMNLFNYLGINHSILMDSDDNEVQTLVNTFIDDNKNIFTKEIHYFDKDLEDFLNIETPNRKDLKPLNIMYKYKNSEISNEKLNQFKEIIERLI
jgi:predicted ATP-dependent endonuclease of OLD family